MAQDSCTSIIRSRLVLMAALLLLLTSSTAAAPPDPPTVVAPIDGMSGVSTSPTLSVDVTDPDGDSMDVSFFGRGAGIGESFTVVVLPDTQNYSDHNQANQAIFSAQTQWIVDNKDALNIVFVTQVGDCVQFGSDFPSEWVTADAALSLLEDPVTTMLPDGIPYGVAVGNHDQSPIGDARVGVDESATTSQYNSTFGVSRFLGRGYYGGHFDFGNPILYADNNDNHYQLFSAGGMDFIVIHLEYDLVNGPTRVAALAWADSLLQTHSDRRAIVVSHYITGIHPGFIAPIPDLQSFGPQGQAIYDALKGNPNLFLTLSGHVSGVGRRVDTFSGNVVHSVLQNYQLEPNGGNGWLRIFEFVPAEDEIRVSTYSPSLDQLWTVNGAEAWRALAENEFTLPYEMNGLELIGSVSGIPNGANANLVWPMLLPNTSYEWFAESNDGAVTTQGPLSTFTTACTANVDCDDGNVCTSNVCNLTTGVCESSDVAALCDDGDLCTQSDSCFAGVCSGMPVLDCCVMDEDCDDASTCTTDSCLSNTCTNTPIPTCCEFDVDCDDANPCTTDTCDGNDAALSFDGIDDSVDLGNDLSITAFGSASLTVEGWFNGDTVTENFKGLFHIGRRGPNSQFAVYLMVGNLIALGVEDTPGNPVDTTPAAFTMGQWNHFAAVLDRGAGQIRLYLNGNLVGSKSLPVGFGVIDGGTDSTVFGALRDSVGALGTFYSGSLDEIRLWSTARTQQEIQDNLNLQLISTAGLVGRWGMNEGFPSATTADSVGSNLGTLSGPAWINSGLAPLGASECSFTPVPGCALDCLSDTDCEDLNDCTDDICNLTTELCEFVDNTAACDDGNACTESDTCNTGVCSGLTIPDCCALDADCDDGSMCTIDSCLSNTCSNAALTDCCESDLACDDGDPCTSDSCADNFSALSFDGVDDSVEFGNDASIVSFGTGSLTVEGWFNPGDNSSGFPGIFHIGRRGVNSQLAVFFLNGPLAVGVEDTAALSLDVPSTIAFNAGQWNHFAAVVDRTLNQLRLYLNGALAGSAVLPAGFGNLEGGTENVAIGSLRSTGGVLDSFYTGALDEIRLWGVVRSPQEIQDGMDLQISTAPGLIARWGLNEGPPNATTADSVDGNVGTLNGATWITSGLPDPLLGGCTFEPIPGCGGCTQDLECDDSDPCTDDTCLPVNSAALSFDGTGDTVEFGNDASINSFGTGSLTVEGWFNPGDNSSGFPGIFHIGRRSANSQVAVFYFNGPLAFGVEDTTAKTLDITSAIAVNAGQWNHFAAVVDRSLDELRLYLNGALAASGTLPAGFAGIEGGTDNVAIGALRSGTGVLDTFYTGALDEIRLWGVARTQQEIQDDMNLEVMSAPGLIARWGLNEGTPSPTTADSVGTNDGTLNGATWIASGLAPLGQCSITPVPDCIPCNSDLDCTDGNSCTLNSCDLATNRCLTLLEPVGTTCADGDLCNGDEQCNGAGACIAGNPPDCDDGVTCTVDGCDPDQGCTQTPDDLLCDDGDPCTDDACDVGGSQCVFTPVPDCIACGGDFLPLQDFTTFAGDEPADWFDTGAANALTFDDNFDVQSVGGELALGTTSALVNIHSHYITAESANWSDYTLSARGLVTSANAGWGVTALSDYPNSDTYYRLRMGSFRRTLHLSPHGTISDCGSDDIGDTGFEPVVGEWFRVKVQVEDDGANTIIRAKAWPDDGTVEPVSWQTECTDSNPSTRRIRGTIGVWSMSSGGHYWDDLQVVSNTGAGSTCDDGDACNGLETCQGGFCVTGELPTCDDGDACNGVETCDSATGCQVGIALDCDDSNPCTTDSCDPTGGCIHTPLVVGSSCSDGNVCNGDETCDDLAVCQGGVAPVCDDGNVCNGAETCDPTGGCQIGVPLVCVDADVCNGLETCDPIDGCQSGVALVCTDGNVCNGLESCDSIDGCQSGSPVDCDDGDPCTTDTCAVTTGECLNDPIPACEPDVKILPIVSLTDPDTTPETTTPAGASPLSETFVPAGQDFWVEIWATDSGVINTGLVAVYVDITTCGDPSILELGHGTIFNVFSSGTIGSGLIDDFGGSAIADGDPTNDGIQPDWVRVGWARHRADPSLLNCEIRVLASGLAPQVSALGRGLVPWTAIQLGSTIISAGQSVATVDYDLDGDGTIGPGDLGLFYVSFGMTVPPGNVAHDFDCDGMVGASDLAWFQSGWMKMVGDPSIQYSPECP